MAETPQARLLIADDHPLMREGIRAMLSGQDDLRVVGEAEDGEEAVEMCRELEPDLVLMDVRMPNMDGLAATREIKRQMPQVGVLIVTTHEDPDYLLEAVRAGAAGYVIKNASRGHFLDAVRRVLGGESPLDQELAMRLLRRVAEEGEKRSDTPPEPAGTSSETLPEPLTPREEDVLRLLVRGRTNREIAHELHFSEGTVKLHVRHIIRKLGVSDRTQAAVRAMELGLIAPG